MAIRVAVIGSGAIAQYRHVPECVQNPQAQLVAVVDANEQRARQVAEHWKVRWLADWRELLRKVPCDAVVVATPNATHAPITIAALKAGKHVLCEKPMATSREDAKAMLRAASASKRQLMIAMNQRLMPPHVKAKEILASGRLGRVLSFRTAFKHAGPDYWSVDRQHSWFFRRGEAMMGVTGDMGVHKVDLLRWLLGEEFAEVSAMLATRDKRYPNGKLIDLDDNATMLLKTRSGVSGVVDLSWTCYSGEENYTVLYGTQGVLSLGTSADFGVIVDYSNGNRDLHKVGAMASNTRQTTSGVMDAFIEGIVHNRAPEIDGREGYRAMDVILCAMESSKSGEVVKISSARV